MTRLPMRRLEIAEIDSTNEEARRRAEAGDPGHLWIRADVQTAGRGRRGRGWASPNGNLMTTLLLRPPCGPGEAAQLSFVAALAVGDLIGASVPADRIGLKWPNDVLVSGAKIAGILLESGAGPVSDPHSRLDWLGIGMGVNLASHPTDLDRPVTDLRAETGAAPSPAQALEHLAAAFERWYAVWDEARGFPAIRTAWLARATGIGGPVRARLWDRTLEGTFDGLDPAGGLILGLADGSREVLHGGEVFFAAAPQRQER